MENGLKKNIAGFVLVLAIISVNFVLVLISMANQSQAILDTFAWGFFNAQVLMLGLYGMSQKEEE